MPILGDRREEDHKFKALKLTQSVLGQPRLSGLCKIHSQTKQIPEDHKTKNPTPSNSSIKESLQTLAGRRRRRRLQRGKQTRPGPLNPRRFSLTSAGGRSPAVYRGAAPGGPEFCASSAALKGPASGKPPVQGHRRLRSPGASRRPVSGRAGPGRAGVAGPRPRELRSA